jgi:viroplasmin and RNaseH domain-containing protein
MNRNEVKEEVDKYPHACHKRFRTLEEAQEFIAQYETARRGVDEQVIWQSHALEDMLQGLNLG